ncbi:MAG: hypothetical protein KKB02_19985 [Alphaproteobacteria bacterium]|nr:hypothetical protein [Alphaproteobacteria bacterium]
MENNESPPGPPEGLSNIVSKNSSEQSGYQEVFPPISETSFPERPFAKRLGEIEESGLRGIGGEIGKSLTFAAYKQIEEDLSIEREKSELKDIKILKLIEDNSKLKTNLSLSLQSNKIRNKLSLASGSIYFIATLLISIGWSDFASPSAKVITIVGGLLFVIGFVLTILMAGRENPDD